MTESLIAKRVTLNKDDVDWFNSTYPDSTLSWALSMLLRKFKESHALTPEDYATIGARALQREIEEGTV